MEKEKLDQVVGVPLSHEQRERLHHVIDKYAPGMAEGKLLRIAWLNFEQQLKSRGPIHLVGEVIGA